MKLNDLLGEQEKLWNALLEKHQIDEKQLEAEHVEHQCASYDALLVDAQKERKKQIEAKQHR